MHVPMVSILPVNYRNTNEFIKHKVTGSVLNPSAGRDLSVSLSLMLIYFHTMKKKLQCDECPYKNSDVRNLRAHKRRHSDTLPFKCAFCGKGFKWIQQRIRHLKSGMCPEQK